MCVPKFVSVISSPHCYSFLTTLENEWKHFKNTIWLKPKEIVSSIHSRKLTMFGIIFGFHCFPLYLYILLFLKKETHKMKTDCIIIVINCLMNNNNNNGLCLCVTNFLSIKLYILDTNIVSLKIWISSMSSAWAS